MRKYFQLIATFPALVGASAAVAVATSGESEVPRTVCKMLLAFCGRALKHRLGK